LTINTDQQGQLSILRYLKNMSCIWFNRFHVPCINQMYKIFLFKGTNKCTWIYLRDFIT